MINITDFDRVVEISHIVRGNKKAKKKLYLAFIP